MTPAEYVNEVVLPTMREARDDRRSRRLAYLACISVFHLKDHLVKAGEQGIENAIRSSAGDAFDVCRAVCNGVKHGETNPNRHRINFSAGTDWHRPPAKAGVMRCGVSRLGDRIGGREIEAMGVRFDLYNAAKRTLRAYQAQYPTHLSGCDLSDL
jgi:hypothetical protein